MATPLGIRIGCNSFLLQDFPFKSSWGFGAATAFSYFMISYNVMPSEFNPEYFTTIFSNYAF